MILPSTLGAIVASASDRAAARVLVAIACEAAGLRMVPHEEAAPHARRVFRALDTIDDLEDLARRVAPSVRGRRVIALRAWRAILTLRALVARGRPVVHDRGRYLADDETGDMIQRWHVGHRVAANDNANDNANERRETAAW